jgi:NAD+ kinase
VRLDVLVDPGADDELADDLAEALEQRGLEGGLVDDVDAAAGDVLALVGDTPFLLEAIREVAGDPAILTVSPQGPGVLAEITANQWPSAVQALAARDHTVEARDRIAVAVDGGDPVLATNEAALLPSTGGQFVRHALYLDGELLWRDRGDGLIVATPTGSTAYALAAGGPVVLGDAPVWSVVPVASSDANEPAVVPADATLVVADAASRDGVDLVVDGSVRTPVSPDDEVRMTRADDPVRFVRLTGPRFGRLLDKLKIERELGPELQDAPPSSKFVYKLLEYEGPLTQQEMAKESQLSARTIRSAIRHLEEEGVVAKVPSLRDARQDVYDLAERVAGPG